VLKSAARARKFQLISPGIVFSYEASLMLLRAVLYMSTCLLWRWLLRLIYRAHDLRWALFSAELVQRLFSGPGEEAAACGLLLYFQTSTVFFSFISSLLSSLSASFSRCFQPCWFFQIFSSFGFSPRPMLLGSVLRGFIFCQNIFLRRTASPYGVTQYKCTRLRRFICSRVC
jgi:hypothetical protein